MRIWRIGISITLSALAMSDFASASLPPVKRPDGSVSHLPEVFARISGWLRQRLDGVPMPNCGIRRG
jgi:hypothetical protein